MNAFSINGHAVGPDQPTYVIAEMSANHLGDYDYAARIVRAACDAGANAIKLQTFTADTITLDSDAPDFMINGGPWDGRTLHDLYGEAYMPWDWQPRLRTLARELGLDFISSPFDETAVDFLQDIGVDAFKIASFENIDIPLLRRAARTGKPVIVSTGMASIDEIAEAVEALRSSECEQLALLKCTSAYPALPEDMNLQCIPDLASRFDVPVGLSDHTMGHLAPTVAVSLGARIIEKHMTLSRADGGPDSGFSMEPDEFKAMVAAVRTAEAALGTADYGPAAGETINRQYRRSLYIAKDMRAGDIITRDNVRSVRPGHGLHTRHLDEVLGLAVARDVAKGTALSWALIAEPAG